MAEPPKFPGFWSGKNIFGPDPVVESFSYTFPKTFLEGAGLPSNEPFMPPDLTTVEPTDKYSQLERDWQNLQKIPEGTRDIFNRIVSEGEPASIWPVQELFPHIEPRSSNPIRSPFPPTNTTPTTRRMVRALNPNPLKVDVSDPRRFTPRFTPGIRGGPWGLLASSLIGGEAHAPTVTQMYDYGVGSADPMHMKPVYFTDRDSPFSWRNPGAAAFSSPPQSLVDRHRDMWSNFQNLRDQNRKAVVEDPARQEIEENRLNTLQGLGLLPFTRSGVLTPQELFKQRNDAEELRLREGRLPVIPEVPIWNPISSAGASTTPVSPDVIFNPPKQYLQSIEQAGALGKDITPKFLGIPSRYHMREYLGATGPEPDTTGDPRVWYTEPVPEWTPPAPVIPDIVVPPPARDEPEPQVEDFSAIQEADRSRQERERKAEVRKAASAARKKEAKREAATKKKAAEQRAKLDSASKKALEEHMAWMETQTKRVAKEEKKRAKRYAGGRGGALMYT